MERDVHCSLSDMRASLQDLHKKVYILLWFEEERRGSVMGLGLEDRGTSNLLSAIGLPSVRGKVCHGPKSQPNSSAGVTSVPMGCESGFLLEVQNKTCSVQPIWPIQHAKLTQGLLPARFR